jgi:hypothetical protein
LFRLSFLLIGRTQRGCAAGNQFLQESSSSITWAKIIAGLLGLSEGEALGVEVVHVACVAVGLRLLGPVVK